MLKASPEDKMLIQMVETANRRLREIQLREEDHAQDIPSDDLVYTKVGWYTSQKFVLNFIDSYSGFAHVLSNSLP